MLNPLWTERFLSNKPREQDHRSPFQRDRARLLHSEAFRCLQAKTQIHAVGEDDFYRTRLTHSLEVAQIGSSLRTKLANDISGFQAVCSDQNFAKFAENLTALVPSRSLMESLCFAHDLGHPPFGHGGESALNYKMQGFGGFEGNAQSFRIVTLLEPYTKDAGMNLTRRTLLGMIKYPALLSQTLPTEPKALPDSGHINLHQLKTNKGIFDEDQAFFDWVLAPLSDHDRQRFSQVDINPEDSSEPKQTRYKSLDCSLMELADDIAYGVHDLEDAIAGGMVSFSAWQELKSRFEQCQSPWIQKELSTMGQKLFSQHRYERKDLIGALVNYFVTHVCWIEYPDFEEPLLRFNATLPPEAREVLDILQAFVFEYVICDAKTQRVEYKGQRILLELFDILSTDPTRLLPRNIRQEWQTAKESKRPRVICDFLASMSDGQAFKLYESLVG